MSDATVKDAYREALGFFFDVVGRIEPGQWGEPALGVWSVKELVGHTARSVFLVDEFGAQRADAADVTSAAHHYHVSLAPEGVDDAIAERGREAGEALGGDPLARLAEGRARAERRVAETDAETIIAYTNGGIALGHYLETRVLELTVHTLDLAAALGVEAEPPREPLRCALHLLAELAVDSGHGGRFALAATGRGLLPDRFSVLG